MDYQNQNCLTSDKSVPQDDHAPSGNLGIALLESEGTTGTVTVRYTSKWISIDSVEADNLLSVRIIKGNSPTPELEENLQNSVDSKSGNDKNPYAYLNRDEFTSEKFKIEVSGLPKHYGFSLPNFLFNEAMFTVTNDFNLQELRKLFNNKLKVNVHKMIPPRKGCSFMFMNFKSEDDRQLAIEKINGYVWKNKILSAKPAKAAEDPLVKKRLNEEIDSGESGFSPNETVEEIIRRVTTPWWNVPYTEQLDRKMTIVKEIFSEMKKGILSVQSNNLKNRLSISEDLIENIKPSPITERYRNKCEFSIGYNPESNEKTVGFRLSSYKNGSTAVGPIDNVTHVPHCMVQVALKFQDFVRKSKYDVYHPETHLGCYRQLTVRATSSDDVMIMVALSRKQISEEDFGILKRELQTEFCSESSVKSFYIKLLTDYGHPDKNPPELLFGSETITEKLLGLKFEISPEAFFQVNLSATEVLYTAIGNLLEQQNATLLDVCSGTGTIGLSISSKCSQVLGIEMVTSAVSDARRNAEINGLSDKCDFFAGKAEDITEPVIVRAKSSNIIAVVDPPRAGLHQKVLFTLRKCEKIQTLIYVACNAKAAMKNFIDLSRPTSNAFKGKPFIPVKLIPVDMFPNSPHFELIIVFARLPADLSNN